MPSLNAPKTEAEVMRRGVNLLAQRLPAGWSARLDSPTNRAIDGLLTVSDAAGVSATLVVEAKRVVEGRDVMPIQEQLDALSSQIRGASGLVIARYLSPPVREKLAGLGISYVDATGNVRVELQSPGLFVSDRGADSDPWRGRGRPRGTLKGEPAAKVVRAIADFAGSWTVRQLVDVSGASTGATYRVVDFLEREGMAARDDDGRVSVLDWSAVLRRWSDDYGFVRTNQTTQWIAPRGLPSLWKQVAAVGDSLEYAITGSTAAAEWAAYAPARLAMIYVADAQKAADLWGLRPTETGVNVVLAQPKYDVVFKRSSENVDNLMVAAPTQVVVDLMTGPGRNPSEAEELLEWMRSNEGSWRY